MIVNTICMTLVASRNLSTLFTSCCMLHPEIQTLNHAPNIVSRPNFLDEYTDWRMKKFVKAVHNINMKRSTSEFKGGLITASHAFNSPVIRRVFKQRFRSEYKEGFKSIVWKDSPNNMASMQKKDLDDLFGKTDKLRFIVVVRNPMDCAVSNKINEFDDEFIGLDKEEILEILLDRYKWFLEAEERFPEFFMHIFPADININTLCKIQEFLMVKRDTRWEKDFFRCWNVMKGRYVHSQEFREQYYSLIQENIASESLRERFERYLR